jgi:hypothetical protein
MLTVCCVKWGTLYGPEYVNVLFDGVRRNLQAGLQGRFVCFTDNPTGLDEGIEIRSLPGGLTGWWNKLYLFAPEAFPKGERVIYFDLDTVITGPLDWLAAYNGPFAILRDVYRPNGLQSSVMAWESGAQEMIWRAWNAYGRPEAEGGDQAWIEHCSIWMEQPLGIWQHLFPGRFRSYKVDCRTQIPKGTSVVFFHGHPRPHEVKSGWVPEVWKVGGGSGIEWIVQANVDDATLKANVEWAKAHAPHWLERGDDARTAVIVGGGPSLAETLFYIRGMQQAGAKVFTVGNAYAYLKDHGITPDAHVLADARPENLSFVPVESVPKYYASQCHPTILAAAGGDLICWHAAGTVYEDLVQGHWGLKVGGGTTVGMKAIALAFALGHRHLRLFGFDSSYGPSHHAYDQPLNDGEKTLDVRMGGRSFKSAPWMVTQAEEFKELIPMLLAEGCVVRIFGDGLIPHIASLLKPPAVDERASQLLEWLEHIPHPQGAEIGVFTGELSSRLLARPDLALYLVDSWTTTEQASDYAQSGDFHAALSQRDQDGYFEQALETVAPFGHRAKVLRMDSIEAANCVPDGSLDFVFIDADHSYEGCKADIKAWLPKLKPSGFLSGHDYDHPEYPDFGVKRAVDEIFGAPERGANYTWRVRLAETWRLVV